MAVKVWLIDKSAYTRLPASPDAQTWVERIERGLVLALDKDFDLIAQITGQPVERLRL